jgi:hypothetical protein
MSEYQINIAGITFLPPYATPVSFKGAKSGKTLAGIDLRFVISRPNINAIEELFKRDSVQVNDPFAGRTYDATFRMTMSSTSDPDRYFEYEAQVREIDVLPVISTIDIDEHTYSVIKHEINGDLYNVLLRLNTEQFIEIQELIQTKYIFTVQRPGIDESPIEYMCGTRWWSKHEAEGEVYYKQILGFFLPEKELKEPPHFASHNHVQAAIDMLAALTARFEALLGDLSQRNIITPERQNELLAENWKELMGSDRHREMNRGLNRVRDAEEQF